MFTRTNTRGWIDLQRSRRLCGEIGTEGCAAAGLIDHRFDAVLLSGRQVAEDAGLIARNHIVTIEQLVGYEGACRWLGDKDAVAEKMSNLKLYEQYSWCQQCNCW